MVRVTEDCELREEYNMEKSPQRINKTETPLLKFEAYFSARETVATVNYRSTTTALKHGKNVVNSGFSSITK
jgi:hypothetical protein